VGAAPGGGAPRAPPAPPPRPGAPPAWGGDGTLFLATNRGKRSLALELGAAEGRTVLARLVGGAEVVIQAFRPDVAERFGLTDEALRPEHPALVLCTVTAYDPKGPRGERPGYDPLLQAHAGLMSVTGPEGGPPVRVGTSLVDLGAGMWAALGVVSALRIRDATGRGSHVRVSLEDTALAWGAYHLMGALATGRAPLPSGTGLGMIAPYGAFPTSDGRLMIAAANDVLFRRCCRALDVPGLASDPRFATNPERVAHRDELERTLGKATRRFSVRELEARLRDAGVPCAAIRDMAEVAGDPAILAGALRPEPHPRIPGYRGVALPVVRDGERLPPNRPPPAVGEHSDEVLGEVGYTAAEVRALREAGIVG
jgi:crotonobetainyl-CoA:carnitine CoA-transferase CaiB-like acyl-CoA transferase